MGLVVVFALMGLLVVIISQKVAFLISLDKESKILEMGLRIFIPFFGLIFIVIGLLVAFNFIQYYTGFQINYFRAYSVIAIGAFSIFGSPLIIKIIFRKFPDNKHILLIGKNGFYVLCIGLGIVNLTAGVLELTGLF